MKRIRHTAEQIIRKLKTAEQLIAQGKTVADVCRAIEVTQPTYHRWKQQYGGMQAGEAKRLTQLEKENAPSKSSWQKPSWRRRCSRTLPRETSEPGTPPQGRHGPAGALPGLRASGMPGCGAAPQHPTPCRQDR
jgi:putative transposase